MLKSLLYVSRSRLDLLKGDAEVEDLLRFARPKNAQLEITGALIFSGASFAQLIEGQEKALDQLMGSILRDPRHTNVRVVQASEIKERRFGGWSMAYSGQSFYVNRHIKPLLGELPDGSGTTSNVERLITLMNELKRKG